MFLLVDAYYLYHLLRRGGGRTLLLLAEQMEGLVCIIALPRHVSRQIVPRIRCSDDDQTREAVEIRSSWEPPREGHLACSSPKKVGVRIVKI